MGVLLAIAAGIFWQYSVADKSISASLIKPEASLVDQESLSGVIQDVEAPAEAEVSGPDARTIPTSSLENIKTAG